LASAPPSQFNSVRARSGGLRGACRPGERTSSIKAEQPCRELKSGRSPVRPGPVHCSNQPDSPRRTRRGLSRTPDAQRGPTRPSGGLNGAGKSDGFAWSRRGRWVTITEVACSRWRTSVDTDRRGHGTSVLIGKSRSCPDDQEVPEPDFGRPTQAKRSAMLTSRSLLARDDRIGELHSSRRVLPRVGARLR
jgi:hypothetical protein